MAWADRGLDVNHGLQAAAKTFEQHCVALCGQLNVPLRVLQVDAGHTTGQSPEDAARIARYKAFDVLARTEHAQIAINSIALAQHADDQVETLLLALSRGAGLAGLSGMSRQWRRAGLAYCRPLLNVAGSDIRRWLHTRNAAFVEDPSNADEKFTRNRIRARIMPTLQAAFPQFLDTFARSARHAAAAQELVNDLAAIDLPTVMQGVDGALLINSLQTLSRTRQANVVRYWLRQTYGAVPSAAQLEELLDQVAACTTRGHRIHIKVGQGFVQRSETVLTWYNQTVLHQKNLT